MHGFVGKGDGYFYPSEIWQAQGQRSIGRGGPATGFGDNGSSAAALTLHLFGKAGQGGQLLLNRRRADKGALPDPRLDYTPLGQMAKGNAHGRAADAKVFCDGAFGWDLVAHLPAELAGQLAADHHALPVAQPRQPLDVVQHELGVQRQVGRPVHRELREEILRILINTAEELRVPDVLDAVEGPPLVLVLDGVTDPHNLGACLRVADGAGAHAVIAPKDHAAGINATVAKVASGAAETMPYFMVTNLARTLGELKERSIWIVGTSDDAPRTIYQADLKVPTALVLGAEGAGMRQLTRKNCDELVSIPMRGAVESLNVSVASGVCLYEALRQRS